MFNAGALVNGPYSPTDIVMSLYNYSAQHTPGYFTLLSVWGNLISWEIPILRYLTVLIGLLSLAMMYRVAADFMSPLAGLFAMIVLGSTAFYGFYMLHIRMYTMLLLFGLLTVWLYLRTVTMHRQPTRWDYGALLLSTVVFLTVHIYSVLVLFSMGVFHLVFAAKNKRWLWVSVAVTGGVLVFSPYFIIIVAGIPFAVEMIGRPEMGFTLFAKVWWTLSSNGSWLLVLAVVVGLIAGIWRGRKVPPYVILAGIYFVAMGIFAEVAPVLNAATSRYYFAAWGLMVLVISFGLYNLYQLNRLFILLLPIWIVNSVLFAPQPTWEQYIAEENSTYLRAPEHMISRLALQEDEPPRLISFADYNLGRYLETQNNMNYSQFYYFFRDRGLELRQAVTVADVELLVTHYTVTGPTIWVYYVNSQVEPDDIEHLDVALQGRYQLCETLDIGEDTTVRKFHWKGLDCGLPIVTASYTSDILSYDFGTTTLDMDNQRLLFTDRWTTTEGSVAESVNFSYQLLTADWEKVAQLDLPIVNDGQHKTFNLSLEGVPAGTYRFVGILYDAATGDKYAWSTSDAELGTMLTLAEVVVP